MVCPGGCPMSSLHAPQPPLRRERSERSFLLGHESGTWLSPRWSHPGWWVQLVLWGADPQREQCCPLLVFWVSMEVFLVVPIWGKLFITGACDQICPTYCHVRGSSTWQRIHSYLFELLSQASLEVHVCDNLFMFCRSRPKLFLALSSLNMNIYKKSFYACF